MRRPVGVKWFLCRSCLSLVSSQPSYQLSPPFHPHSSMSEFFRSVQVGFRVVRGGIGFTQRLGAKAPCAYRRLAYSPSNPSVSRTDQPPPEKISGDGRGSSPETPKRLAVLVFPRRSLLLSSTESG